MRLLLLGNITSYESKRIAEEAVGAGLDFRALSFNQFQIEITTEKCSFTDDKGKDITDYDVYIFRGVGDHRWEAMVFARYLRERGKIIIENKMAEGRYVLTKLPYSLAAAGIPVIPTKLIFKTSEAFENSLKFPLVVRSTFSRQGRDIFKVDNLAEFHKAYKAIGPKVIVMPYLPIKFDYRVFIVGQEILGVMKKYNDDVSIVTNISAGGRAEKAELPQEVLDICLKAMKASRVEIGGVDVLEYQGKYYILEVNAIPQFRGFENVTGRNVAKKIVEYAVKCFKEE